MELHTAPRKNEQAPLSEAQHEVGVASDKTLWRVVDMHTLLFAVALNYSFVRLFFISLFILDYKDNKQYGT